jgi:DNA-binding NarL/FixJ family response regulator
MISVLVADDQALVREGLRMLIKPEPDLRVVGEAGDGAEAVAQVRRLDPDVVLMDVRMPRVDGIQATAQLARSGCRARILMLTTYDLDEYVYRAMKSGACGFLLKDATREQLTEAVRSVSAGHLLLAPSILRRLIDEFGSPVPAASVAPAADVCLSERELDVVHLVANGLSNAEIAADLCLSEATVKSHVARILDRLGLRSRVQIAIFAYEHALVSTERGLRGTGERPLRGQRASRKP